ncbi:ExeA family protein [Acidicapsa dinghuensis]|uniref:ExeA family protein n=1 Tax=Acidicapsa dinghuensis TaxID=2218256 RepID=A0ABW1ELK1_9BACT|nr:AAA family ATPase [Acidicapsa dinghuensis]
MIAQHFKLREQPFGVTPDPKYMFPSTSHREALASLLYGLQSGLGFVSLIAKPGMGKTTLLFEVLSRLRDTKTTVFLFQTITTPMDLLRAILIDLGAKDVRKSLVDLQTQLNKVLLNQHAAHRSVVVVLDEAQNLNDSVLETVRMLSNFETSSQKLMQIVLAGQPQLAEKLMTSDLLQLRQRISIFAHLTPLSMNETAAYIRHRLRYAGLETEESIFTPSALALIARHSEGIPRNINNLCFNAMSLAFALKRHKIDSEIVNEVISDLSVKEHLLSAEGGQLGFAESAPLEISEEKEEIFISSDDHPAQSDVGSLIASSEHLIPEPQNHDLQTNASQIYEYYDPISSDNPLQISSEKELADLDTEITSNNVALLDSPAFAGFERHSRWGSNSASWKLAAVVTIAFVTGVCVWFGIVDYRVVFPGRVIQASSEAMPALSTDDSQSADQPKSVPSTAHAHRGSVRVRKAESLSALCDSVYGKCTPELIEQLLASNPSVLYPNRLNPGQIITLPLDTHNAKTER